MEAVEGGDFISAGNEMGLNQTLISKNEVFKMGFWRPPELGEYYLSIWYASIPLNEKAIIWTAPTPCAKRLCKLELRRRNGLVIHGTNWSSSANVTAINTAKLTGEGNLIVFDTNDNSIWESFENPTNVIVPGQKFKPGQSLYSWKSDKDPGRGNYKLQVVKQQGISKYGPPDYKFLKTTIKIHGLVGDLYGEFLQSRRTNLLVANRIVAYRDILNTSDASAPARIHLDFAGVLNLEIWFNGSWEYSWNQTFIISPDSPSPSLSPAPSPAVLPPGKSKGSSKGLSMFALICIVMFYAVMMVLCSVWRKRRTRLKGSTNVGSAAPTRFDYKLLKQATDNFKEKLGNGGCGCVYKGILENNTPVAVKILNGACLGNKGFENEVMSIGSIHHVNVVRLIGFCTEGEDRRLLVYEYMENRSLDKHLFSRSSILPWPARFKIALGVAKGLAYCHDHCRSRIVHCDLKPDNILLDSQMEPKISDFGLAKLMARDQSGILTKCRGTRGYFAPEWMLDVPITVKADVYSYGQMLFELISGRRNLMTAVSPEKQYYPRWSFKQIMEGNAVGMVDAKLGSSVDVNQVEMLFKVAFWCIQADCKIRPSMAQVVQMIEGSMQVEMPPRPKNLLFQVDLLVTSDTSS